MDLKVDYQNSKDKKEAYQKVKAAITPEVIGKFNVKADFDYKENEKISASGKDQGWCNHIEGYVYFGSLETSGRGVGDFGRVDAG